MKGAVACVEGPEREHQGGDSDFVQVILFVDDKDVSKGMVKYATAIQRESIVDVSGEVHVPEAPVAGCTCSKVASKASHKYNNRIGATSPKHAWTDLT